MPNGDASPNPHLRILHVTNGYMYGGVETALSMMARYREVCPAMEPQFALCFDGRLAEELCRTGVAVHLLGDSREGISRKSPELRGGLARILDDRRYDAVICHMLMVQAIFGALLHDRGILNILYTHGATPPVWEWWADQVPPDHLIYNSEHMRKTSSHLFRGVSGSVIYYPALAPEIQLGTQARRELRESNGVGENDLVIVHAARLEPMKGQRELLRAAAGLTELNNWVIWMVGGPQREKEEEFLEELKQLARTAGIDRRIRFLGQRSDVPLLLRAADILCQPNLKTESFGMSFIEAEFAGLPVVTTAFGGALEAVGEGCGILIPPDDIAALNGCAAKTSDRSLFARSGKRKGTRTCESTMRPDDESEPSL